MRIAPGFCPGTVPAVRRIEEGQEQHEKKQASPERYCSRQRCSRCRTLISSCGAGNPQADDLQNVNPSYPNYAAIYMDVDGFPNIVEECINGAGFALTTRDAAGAVTRVPEWDAFCVKQIGKQATQGGQP